MFSWASEGEEKVAARCADGAAAMLQRTAAQRDAFTSNLTERIPSELQSRCANRVFSHAGSSANRQGLLQGDQSASDSNAVSSATGWQAVTRSRSPSSSARR